MTVTTPQQVATIDVLKSMEMFKKVNVPLLGVIENMAYFVAPDTGARYDIFGTGGAARLAEQLGVPLLGQIPLGHLGKPADIAHAVAYLASPQAAYVTGQELHVNGGMFMV